MNFLMNFQENDIIQLITKVDDNWFEGKVNGVQGNYNSFQSLIQITNYQNSYLIPGYFPQSYVQVKVPLP